MDDVFLGLAVPEVRSVAKAVRRSVTPELVSELLDRPEHEARLLAGAIMCELVRPARAEAESRRQYALMCIDKAERLNNWDLVDTIAPHVTGPWITRLAPSEQWQVLEPLIVSPLLWRRRIAMVSMFGPLRAGDTALPLAVAGRLVHDPHDLMHKAVGWLLREVGKVDRPALDGFLDEHAATMPRTALRYALEKHEPDSRAHYMGLRQRR